MRKTEQRKKNNFSFAKTLRSGRRCCDRPERLFYSAPGCLLGRSLVIFRLVRLGARLFLYIEKM